MATVHFHNETELLQVYHEPQTGLPFTLAPGESRDIEVPDEPYYPFLLANGTQELKENLPVAESKTIDGVDISAGGTTKITIPVAAGETILANKAVSIFSGQARLGMGLIELHNEAIGAGILTFHAATNQDTFHSEKIAMLTSTLGVMATNFPVYPMPPSMLGLLGFKVVGDAPSYGAAVLDCTLWNLYGWYVPIRLNDTTFVVLGTVNPYLDASVHTVNPSTLVVSNQVLAAQDGGPGAPWFPGAKCVPFDDNTALVFGKITDALTDMRLCLVKYVPGSPGTLTITGANTSIAGAVFTPQSLDYIYYERLSATEVLFMISGYTGAQAAHGIAVVKATINVAAGTVTIDRAILVKTFSLGFQVGLIKKSAEARTYYAYPLASSGTPTTPPSKIVLAADYSSGVLTPMSMPVFHASVPVTTYGNVYGNRTAAALDYNRDFFVHWSAGTNQMAIPVINMTVHREDQIYSYNNMTPWSTLFPQVIPQDNNKNLLAFTSYPTRLLQINGDNSYLFKVIPVEVYGLTEAPAVGGNVAVTINGKVGGFAGLTAGRMYYAQYDGTVALKATPFPLGLAVSTTEIFVTYYKGYN